MSFDVHLCVQDDSLDIDAAIAEFCGKNSDFTAAGGDPATQWFYQNESTGVYFWIDREGRDSDLAQALRAEGLSYAGWTMGVNYMRPQFFALEALTILTELCHSAGLLVFDPQLNEDNARALQAESKVLIESWTSSNDLMGPGLIERQGENRPRYVFREVSNRIWKYHFLNESLYESIDLDIFLCTVRFIHANDSRIVYTAGLWTDSIATSLPECDYFIIFRNEMKRTPPDPDDLRLIDRKALIGLLKGATVSRDTAVGSLELMNPAKAKKISKAFDKAWDAAEPDFNSKYTVLASEEIVDIQPE